MSTAFFTRRPAVVGRAKNERALTFFSSASLFLSNAMAAAKEAPPPPRPPPDARPPAPERPLRRLKVVVRGLPAGVDAGLARERIARAAGGAPMVQWLRLWGASER